MLTGTKAQARHCKRDEETSDGVKYLPRKHTMLGSIRMLSKCRVKAYEILMDKRDES